MVLPGRMIISPDTFHCCEALSYRLWVCGKMAGKHFPDEVRDAPLFLGGESLESFILPVFKQNVGLMHIFPLEGGCHRRHQVPQSIKQG
jgi:hypothetical protein